MSLETAHEKKLFELLPKGKKGRGHIIKKKRCLVGSSESCDIVIQDPGINAIHAVLEVKDGEFKLYDMHGKLGTFINGKKITAASFGLKDTIAFGPHLFDLKIYRPEDILPPVLNVLDPKIEKKVPILPQSPPDQLKRPEYIPVIEYPLAKDPKAEFSSYIFEDADTIYPIFNYQTNQTAVEVIILFKGMIYSVDYLPVKEGIFKLVGMGPSPSELVYPYLGKEEKVEFLEVTNGQINVSALFGYECLHLSDQKINERKDNFKIPLKTSDIISFSKENLQIFVRISEKPPKIKSAPILRREGDLRKYLFLVFLFIFAFLGIMYSITVDKEIEKEKMPERIATILYKERLTLSEKRAIVKNKKAPKIIKMRTPKKNIVLKKEPKKKLSIKNPVKKRKIEDQTKKKKSKPKKATPNKAKKNNTALKVGPTKKSTKKSRKNSQAKKTLSTKKSNRRSKSKGNVDTFKSSDFSNSLSSLLAKGGTTRRARAQAARSSDVGSNALGGTSSATLKRAKVSNNIGSLSGSLKGKLDASTGASGLGDKKSIFTVGMPGETVVFGGMDPDIIRRILNDHKPQFRYCYQRVLDNSANPFEGLLTMNFKIGPSGHVTSAGAAAAKGKMPVKVKRCVRNVLIGIKFPEPPGGGRVEVSQPFSFYPKIR